MSTHTLTVPVCGALALLSGCGASSGSDAGETASQDSATPSLDVASPASDAAVMPELVCGAGGTLGDLRVVDVTSGRAVPEARVTGSGCNEVAVGADGVVRFEVTAGALLALELSAPRYLPLHLEMTPVASGADRVLVLFPEGLRSTLFTGGSDADGFVVVAFGDDGSGAGPCTATDGLAVTVRGRPEIAVGYMPTTATRDPALTATTPLGLAVVGPLPPGRYEIDGSSAACIAGPDPGRYFLWPQASDVRAGSVSAMILRIGPR